MRTSIYTERGWNRSRLATNPGVSCMPPGWILHNRSTQRVTILYSGLLMRTGVVPLTLSGTVSVGRCFLLPSLSFDVCRRFIVGTVVVQRLFWRKFIAVFSWRLTAVGGDISLSSPQFHQQCHRHQKIPWQYSSLVTYAKRHFFVVDQGWCPLH